MPGWNAVGPPSPDIRKILRAISIKASCIFKLAAASLLLALSGCTGGGQSAELEDYLQRLARPLDIAVTQVEFPKNPAPPRAEAIRLSLEGGKLDGLDFLRLRGCALQQTVARRNSSLGRVAPPSQRLLMELAFLRDAPTCVATLLSDGREALAVTIRESMALKQAQLPALIFNATLGNREYRDFWRAREAPGEYPGQTSSLVITALEHITADASRWLGGNYQADETRFELALSELARGDGGELLDALSRQAAYLEAANKLIDERLAVGPLCTENTSPASAAIVRTVVGKFFVGRVQARGADLNQRYYQLSQPVAGLETLLAKVLPEDFKAWQDSREASFEGGMDATRRHVEKLQSLLGPCYAEFASE